MPRRLPFLLLAGLVASGALLLLLLAAPLLLSSSGTPAYVQRVTLDEAKAAPVAGSPITGPAGAPLVVIDAGHGGHDPGAVASNGIREKDVVLGLADALRDALVEDGTVRIAMTRASDRFIPLEERTALARELDADLFISIHADSGGDEQNAAGASIYTLSARASGQQAARFAARENRAGAVDGALRPPSDTTVDTMLFELSQRRALTEATEFARLLVREASGELRFRDPPRRSAALIVLTAPDIPSVLLEAGFVTNLAEAERMSSHEGQEQFARVTAAAIRSYFANRDDRSTLTQQVR